MGPEIKEETFKTSQVEKIINSTKKITEGFFKDPLYYIFYISLIAIIVSLFFNKFYPLVLYILIGCIGIIKFFNFLKNKEKI